jgi:hypothetical protein
MKASCIHCGACISASHRTVFGRECTPCWTRRTAVRDIKRLAERIIGGADSDALELAVGRLTDICLERGL